MKITVLTENTSCDPAAFGCEHGLSLYIETGGHRILFDAGQSALFAENADKLGVDLAAVEFAVLSHGHYDHGGGLSVFLERNTAAPVYMSRYAFEKHFAGDGRDIGLDPALQREERIVFCGDEEKIAPGLTLYSCNEKPRSKELGDFGMTAEIGGVRVPEDFRHEQYLLVREGDRRILISGCSHKGVLDIANWFRPDVLIGGFHLMKQALDGKLADYARRLDRLGTEFYTCHCTGEEQYAFIQPYMSRLHYIRAGMQLEV
ncbi:MAG: MBL fold metallo-hydrolase [Lachnospiraceae bacterium]|nr:MBL fold metallo-hydrolase [Lachnospiraceae bacterium]